jgi:hypothetical protein
MSRLLSWYSDGVLAGRPEFDYLQCKISLFSTASRSTFSPLSLCQYVLGVKRQGRETDHSPPSSAEVKKGGAIPPLPPYVFIRTTLYARVFWVALLFIQNVNWQSCSVASSLWWLQIKMELLQPSDKWNIGYTGYTTIRIQNKEDTTASTVAFIMFMRDATCFDPFAGYHQAYNAPVWAVELQSIVILIIECFCYSTHNMFRSR